MHNDNEADPLYYARATKKQQMGYPHRVQHRGTYQPELNSDRKGLVMRVGGHQSGNASVPKGRAAEQFPDRPGTVADNWRICDKANGLSPIFQPLARRRWRVLNTSAPA